jgi:glycosyltransferase involved in cell wall biosynthesis
VSSFVKDKHVKAGWPSERIRVKSNFSWDTPRRRGPGDYFLYAGRLAAEKGIAGLVEAWRDIPGPLLVVGDGPERERLRAVAPPTVEFRSGVPPGEVAGLLSRARALMLPSIWYEGAPRIIVEAFAAGVPVLASRIGGIPESLDDGVSGLLVSPGVREEWADAVLRLLDDAFAAQLGDGAWSVWRERFSPERALDELESCYLQALSIAGR